MEQPKEQKLKQYSKKKPVSKSYKGPQREKEEDDRNKKRTAESIPTITKIIIKRKKTEEEITEQNTIADEKKSEEQDKKEEQHKQREKKNTKDDENNDKDDETEENKKDDEKEEENEDDEREEQKKDDDETEVAEEEKRDEESEEEKTDDEESEEKKRDEEIEQQKKVYNSEDSEETEEDEEVEEKGKEKYKQYRFTLNPTIELIKKIKERITKKHLEVMQQTPFNNLFMAFYNGWIGHSSNRYVSEAIREILKKYSLKDDYFKIGKKAHIHLKPKDVAVIFGMRLIGKEKNACSKETRNYSEDPFCAKYFKEEKNKEEDDKEEDKNKKKSKKKQSKKKQSNKKQNKKSDQLKQKLTSVELSNLITEVVGEKGKELDFVKLIIMHMAANFLFNNLAGSNVQISFTRMIKDIATMNRISWPKTILSYMKKMIEKNIDNLQNCSGALILLPVWIAEHCRIGGAETNEENTPRIARWNIDILVRNFKKKLHDLANTDINKEMQMPTTELENDLVEDGEYDEVNQLNQTIQRFQEENNKLHEQAEILKQKIENLKKGEGENEGRNIHTTETQKGFEQRIKQLEEKFNREKVKYMRELAETKEQLKEALEKNEFLKNSAYGVDLAKVVQEEVNNRKEQEVDQDFEVPRWNEAIHEENSGNDDNFRVKRRREPKQKMVVDPSSLVKGVKKRKTRTEKQIGSEFLTEIPVKKTRKKKGEGNAIQNQEEEKKRKKKIEFRDWTTSPVWKCVKEKELKMLNLFRGIADQDEKAWSSPDCSIYITGRELDEMMMNDYIDASIIDWYCYNLKEKFQNRKEERKIKDTIIFSAHMWSMLKNPDTQHHVKELLDDRLDNELTFTTKKLLFPMNNASSQERYLSGFHWSLLTYDIQSNEWVHYNSLNHGDKTVQKQCIKEVNTLQKHLVEKITRHTNIRMMNKNGATVPIRCNKIIQADVEKQLNSPDCAMFVCKFIRRCVTTRACKKLSDKEMVEKAQRKRAKFAFKMLTDGELSWNPELDDNEALEELKKI